MMKKIAGIPLLYEPGTKWSYSVAVDIQGYLVQKLSGQKFGDYLKAHVTGPIGMTDTAFYVSPDRKSRFTEVYHWDRDKNQLVMNVAADRPRRLRGSGAARVGRRRPRRLDARLRAVLPDAAQQGRDRRQAHPQGRNSQADEPRTISAGCSVGVDGTRPQPGAEAVRFGLDFAVYVDPKPAGLPYGNGTFYWGGAAGTWFWIDPVNDLAFIGMIQMQGGNRPDGLNFRADSAKLVYAALAPSATKSSAAVTSPNDEGTRSRRWPDPRSRRSGGRGAPRRRTLSRVSGARRRDPRVCSRRAFVHDPP